MHQKHIAIKLYTHRVDSLIHAIMEWEFPIIFKNYYITEAALKGTI